MIYYITYVKPDILAHLNLKVSPAGDQKSKYIAEVLDSFGEEYKIIDLAETTNKNGYYKSIEKPYLNNGQIMTFNGFGKPNRIFNKLHYYYTNYQLKRFLTNLTSKDIVISYHSLLTAELFAKVKKKYDFKLVLELEEKYQDVVNCSNKLSFWEDEVIKAADGYILATEFLSNYIPNGKPYVVCNGTYKIEHQRRKKRINNTIHCVYAGTFDPSKGGAAAAAAAEFLGESYHMHILGFGSDEQINNIKNIIYNVSNRTKCKISYDGLKSGEEYIEFLQSCDIGLCTQIPDAQYVNTSFPSKILVYLANGLRVVSINIPAVKMSEIGDQLFYYNEQCSKEIAEAIEKVDLSTKFDPRRVLMELDKKLKVNLRSLILNLEEDRGE